MSYNEWLKNQPNNVQDALLGKKRAADYRAGKYKADKFVEYGKPLSLDELNGTNEISLTDEGANDVKGKTNE